MNNFTMAILWVLTIIGIVNIMIKSHKLDKAKAFELEIKQKHFEFLVELLESQIQINYQTDSVKYIIESDRHIGIWKVFTDEGDYYYETAYYFKDGRLVYSDFVRVDES